jgi:hypothetical protein
VKPNRMRGLLLALSGSLALVLASVGMAGTLARSGSTPEVDRLVESIRKHRSTTWHWQRVMGKGRAPAGFMEGWVTDPERLAALRDLWKSRLVRHRTRAQNPPHEQAWRCIHRHEAPWDDPNAPYYGGLQMDKAFQRAYGRHLLRRKGTANKWRPAEQMWTAERALRAGSGFHPWPNAARYCGLL